SWLSVRGLQDYDGILDSPITVDKQAFIGNRRPAEIPVFRHLQPDRSLIGSHQPYGSDNASRVFASRTIETILPYRTRGLIGRPTQRQRQDTEHRRKSGYEE